MSRGTFYALFADRDECLAAVYADLREAVIEELTRLEADTASWRERMRAGLAAILSLLDREPALARVCIVECARGGPMLIEARECAMRQLASAFDAGRLEPDCELQPTEATAEILVHAAHGIVQSRLASPSAPLVDLFGELMGLIVLPYLGPVAAQEESRRSAPVPPPDRRGEAGEQREPISTTPLSVPKIRLTYRTTRVLECIAESPGATNIAVARAAGVADQGQISKLLARLEQHGLVLNSGEVQQKWSVNTWSLTARGEALIQGVRRQRPVPAPVGS